MDLKKKSDKLALRMNKITDEFTKNLDISDDLDVQGDDIIEYVEEKTQDIVLFEEDSKDSKDSEKAMSNALATRIINLTNMVEDFKYVRDTLRENTDNGRRILNSVTLDLLDSDEDTRASLVQAFAELNNGIALNMKLYISSYKEISTVLLNLDKIKKEEAKNPTTVNNTLNINASEAVSTFELIKKMKVINPE